MTPKKIGRHLDTKGIDLWSSFNSKLRYWSTRCQIHSFLMSVSSDACQEHYLTLIKNLGSFYNHTGYLYPHANVNFLTSEKDFMRSKMQNIKCRGQERDSNRALHIILTPFREQRLSFLSGFNVTCPWQPFASLVPSPQNSVIARGRQFFINKSEKFKEGVKWGVKCKYKFWIGDVLIYKL
jgi:hypothetical protein